MFKTFWCSALNIYLLNTVVSLWLLPIAGYAQTIEVSGPFAGEAYELAEFDLKLVWIAPGEFTMGSPRDEGGHELDEVQHQVTITDGFWLGATEVTVGQWSRFVEQSDYQTEAERGDGVATFTRGQWVRTAGTSWRRPGFTQTDQHPVVGVSWKDAVEFCRWLNDHQQSQGHLPDNYRYALPTEAQWEYACRAGSSGPFIGGGGNNNDEIWFRYGDGVGGILAESNSQPVATRKVNDWGLFDVHGNVFEWCQDWYTPELRDHAVDPSGPVSGTERVCRGGAWSSYSRSIRSAFRGRAEPNTRGNNLGFRLSLRVTH